MTRSQTLTGVKSSSSTQLPPPAILPMYPRITKPPKPHQSIPLRTQMQTKLWIHLSVRVSAVAEEHIKCTVIFHILQSTTAPKSITTRSTTSSLTLLQRLPSHQRVRTLLLRVSNSSSSSPSSQVWAMLRMGSRQYPWLWEVTMQWVHRTDLPSRMKRSRGRARED